MNKIKILVVEDEILIADNICNKLKDFGYDVFEPALDFEQAITSIEAGKPDIAILDIQLSGKKTGIDLAYKINEAYKFPFIFLTSNSDLNTVTQAKKVNPHAFLVKPYSKEELYASIEVALYNFSKNVGEINESNLIIKDALFVKDKGFFNKLLFDNILYLKAAHVYVEIFLNDSSVHVVRSSLIDIIDNLNSKFIRVHRGYIINTDHLQQINHSSITIGSESIPIGKTFREKLIKRINLI